MERLKRTVSETIRQFNPFKKEHKKMNTTFKKKAGVVLFIIFAIFCGLQFVFNNSLTANAEIALTASADGVVKPSKELPLYPYSYTQDFEQEDPFKEWAKNGTYTLNYKGITNERSSSGKHSFKIDITFGTATYVYFNIPVMVPSIGKLDFKGDIYVSEASSASATLGTNISLNPCPRSGVNSLTKIDSSTGKWITQTSDIVSMGQLKTTNLLEKYCASATLDDVGIWTDKIALYLFGKAGSKITVFVDNIKLDGNIPNKDEYNILSASLWKAYQLRMQSELNTLKAGIGTYRDSDSNNIITASQQRGYPTPEEYSLLKTISEEYKYTQASTEGDIIICPWTPITDQKILPLTYPLPAIPGNVISIKACRNEFEPASFILRANKNLSNIKITATDFIDEKGNLIPSNSVDIRLVKCWYQSGEDTIRKTDNKVLVPELLLKDDSLVKVDYDNKINYLKVLVGGSEQFIDISTPTAIFPENAVIKDADVLNPFDMLNGTNKQVWITTHIPKDAAAGDYKGSININTGGDALIPINVLLTVLPFELSEPMLEYSLYYRGKLKTANQSGIDSEWKTEEQYRIEIEDMKSHGVSNQTIYQKISDGNIENAIKIRQDVGASSDNLYIFGSTAGKQTTSSEIETLTNEVKQWLSIASKFNYKKVYIYGIDEVKGEALLSELPAWRKVRELGANMFVACYSDAIEFVGEELDLAILGGGSFYPSMVNLWHAKGKKVYAYGNPQVGVENPFVYRHNYGFELYVSGYDGVMNYAYQHSFGHIWNDFDHDKFRDHVFAYPTTNGVIGTIQWEGFREGIDDIRYLSTLLSISYENSDVTKLWVNTELKASKDSQAIRDKIIEKIITSSK